MWAGYRSTQSVVRVPRSGTGPTDRQQHATGHVGDARGMHTLLSLVLAVAACAIALPRPPTPVSPVADPSQQYPLARPNEFLEEYVVPRLLLPRYMGVDESPRNQHYWVNREIERLTQLEDQANPARPYSMNLPRWVPHSPAHTGMQVYMPEPKEIKRIPDVKPPAPVDLANKKKQESTADSITKEKFALTPLEKGYFGADPNMQETMPAPSGARQGIPVPQRQTRQNPNLSRTKTLVASNIDQLRAGLGTVEDSDSTDHPRQIHIQEPSAADPAESIYGVALVAAVGAALTMAIIGFAFGWYTLSRKAKAAADVDYPAYGVTGPTLDNSGDRKLAHSAHMYHYQHQKQQIIAMERNGMVERNGSVSDPESEEENEEGDYTVYECPGFATTGEMEVKNPLFTGDPTPATPGKCELVKPQPKE